MATPDVSKLSAKQRSLEPEPKNARVSPHDAQNLVQDFFSPFLARSIRIVIYLFVLLGTVVVAVPQVDCG